MFSAKEISVAHMGFSRPFTTVGSDTEAADSQGGHQYTGSRWLLFFQEGIEMVVEMIDGLVNALAA